MALEPQALAPLGRHPIGQGGCLIQLGSEPLQPLGIPTCRRHRNRRMQPLVFLGQKHRLQLMTIGHQPGKHQCPPALAIQQQVGQLVAHTQAEPRLQQLVVPGGGEAQAPLPKGLALPAAGPAAPVMPLPPGLPAAPEVVPPSRQGDRFVAKTGRHKPVHSSRASASTPSRQRRAKAGSIGVCGSCPWLCTG